MGITRKLEQLEGGTKKGENVLRRKAHAERTDDRDMTPVAESLPAVRENWRKERQKAKGGAA